MIARRLTPSGASFFARVWYRVATLVNQGATMVIRRIGVGAAAKVFGTLYALWGFIFGVIVALIALAGAGLSAASDDPLPAWLGTMFGMGAVVILPVIYGLMGAIFGALTAVFYNLVAGIAGGLSFEVE
jgi:hypothetical protein